MPWFLQRWGCGRRLRWTVKSSSFPSAIGMPQEPVMNLLRTTVRTTIPYPKRQTSADATTPRSCVDLLGYTAVLLCRSAPRGFCCRLARKGSSPSRIDARGRVVARGDGPVSARQQCSSAGQSCIWHGLFPAPGPIDRCGGCRAVDGRRRDGGKCPERTGANAATHVDWRFHGDLCKSRHYRGLAADDAPRSSCSKLRNWDPVGGGLALLAFLGFSGKNINILAHVMGFGSGLVAGVCALRWPGDWPTDRGVQWMCAGTAGLTVVAAWVAASLA